MMEYWNCSCGSLVVVDTIYCQGAKGLVEIAKADMCPRCRKVYAVRMVPNHPPQVNIGMVERAYKAVKCNHLTWEELKGTDAPWREYNPNQHIEPEEKEIL